MFSTAFKQIYHINYTSFSFRKVSNSSRTVWAEGEELSSKHFWPSMTHVLFRRAKASSDMSSNWKILSHLHRTIKTMRYTGNVKQDEKFLLHHCPLDWACSWRYSLNNLFSNILRLFSIYMWESTNLKKHSTKAAYLI